eukprot:CAMPEP_0201539648 /NCGR_PEP_ID=MMETSP0161_2-20130828/70519_1 /ASSEMBLY_ACC=CAM_ASM_000251 /TAXON_ID=180227 /ORGANISM="Neoparamoeba aestuarina, Strain SoJaBio B1-5/56/2" /LENGTH=115 /DNA_ID=CAMNT_0047947059 /DNA_START=717 /DNA_END=1060 /DNA_ORIENTATION=-
MEHYIDNPDVISIIEWEFREFLDFMKENPAMLSQEYKFSLAWKDIAELFPMLREFRGGIATIFPGTSAVESDFSRLGYLKSHTRSELSFLAAEGQMHASLIVAFKHLWLKGKLRP